MLLILKGLLRLYVNQFLVKIIIYFSFGLKSFLKPPDIFRFLSTKLTTRFKWLWFNGWSIDQYLFTSFLRGYVFLTPSFFFISIFHLINDLSRSLIPWRDIWSFHDHDTLCLDIIQIKYLFSASFIELLFKILLSQLPNSVRISFLFNNFQNLIIWKLDWFRLIL